MDPSGSRSSTRAVVQLISGYSVRTPISRASVPGVSMSSASRTLTKSPSARDSAMVRVTPTPPRRPWLSLIRGSAGNSEADGTVYFRRATAHRLLHMTDQVLDDIDYALSLLPPGNNEINQDYLRERQLIGLIAHLRPHLTRYPGMARISSPYRSCKPGRSLCARTCHRL